MDPVQPGSLASRGAQGHLVPENVSPKPLPSSGQRPTRSILPGRWSGRDGMRSWTPSSGRRSGASRSAPGNRLSCPRPGPKSPARKHPRPLSSGGSCPHSAPLLRLLILPPVALENRRRLTRSGSLRPALRISKPKRGGRARKPRRKRKSGRPSAKLATNPVRTPARGGVANTPAARSPATTLRDGWATSRTIGG